MGEAPVVRSTSARRSTSCPLPGETVVAEAPAPPVLKASRARAKPVPAFPGEPLSRASEFAAENMRQLTGMVPSTWVRLVHSGYGSQTFVQDLKDSTHVHVVTERPQEGIYVRVPAGGAVNDLVDKLMAMNLVVRKKTQFKDMKRSNKSRLQFKATVKVFPSERQQAEHDSTLASGVSEEMVPETPSSCGGEPELAGKQQGMLPEQLMQQIQVGPQSMAQGQPPYFVYYVAPQGYPQGPPQPARGRTANPGYWNTPNTYDWEEGGQPEDTKATARNDFRSPSPELGSYHPQVAMQPEPMGGSFQQVQPVYWCVGMMKNPLYAEQWHVGYSSHM